MAHHELNWEDFHIEGFHIDDLNLEELDEIAGGFPILFSKLSTDEKASALALLRDSQAEGLTLDDALARVKTELALPEDAFDKSPRAPWLDPLRRKR